MVGDSGADGGRAAEVGVVVDLCGGEVGDVGAGDFDGLDDIVDLRAVFGALLTFVLMVAFFMLTVWALATTLGNYATASKSRVRTLVAVAAVLPRRRKWARREPRPRVDP